MSISDTSTEPDETRYSDVYSRRNILKAGATGLAASLAGCSALSNDGPVNDGDSTPPPPSTDGINFNIVELALDEVSFKMDSFPRPYPDTITVTAYRKPVLMDDSEKVQIGQSQYQSFPDTFNMDIDLTGEMDIAHQLIFTLSRDGDTPEEIYRTGNAILPFNNEAKGEQQVRVVGPIYQSDSSWSSPQEAHQKVEIWYNESDEPFFNTPKLDRTQYTQEEVDGEDWFNLYNLEITAVIRTPILSREFAVNEDGEVQGPYFDWTVVNLKQSAIEYLEALLFNSIATQKLLNTSGEWSAGNWTRDNKQVEDKEYFGSTIVVLEEEIERGGVSRVAQDAVPASDYFLRGSAHQELNENEYSSTELDRVNPIKFSVGRSVCRRWGEKFSQAVENKPYSDTYESIQYQKLTTLKAFIGDSPYDFTIQGYQYAPEETVVNLYRRSKGEDAPGADCATASFFFTGVAYWMTGLHPVLVAVDVGQNGHMFAGLQEPTLPDVLSEIQDMPTMNYTNFESEPHTAPEISYGYTDVESTEGYSTIGFNRNTLDDSSRRLHFWSNLNDLTLTSTIPLNDNFEPDENGTIRAPSEGIYTYQVDPFDTTAWYYFEDERNR